MLPHFYLPTFSLLSNISCSFIRKHLIFDTFWSSLRSHSLNRPNHIKKKGWLILICWPSSSTGNGPGEMILSIFLSSKPPSNHFLQGNMNSRARRPSPSFTIIWLRNQPPPKFTEKKIKICGTIDISSINISLLKKITNLPLQCAMYCYLHWILMAHLHCGRWTWVWTRIPVLGN